MAISYGGPTGHGQLVCPNRYQPWPFYLGGLMAMANGYIQELTSLFGVAQATTPAAVEISHEPFHSGNVTGRITEEAQVGAA